MPNHGVDEPEPAGEGDARAHAAPAPGSAQHAHVEEVHVGRLTKLVAHRPALCAGLIFFLCWASMGVIIVVLAFGRDSSASNFFADAANTVPFSAEQLREDALVRMLQDRYVGEDEDEEDDDPVEREREWVGGVLWLSYADLLRERQMLTREHVLRIAQVERALLDAGSWGAFCRLKYSGNGQERGCESPTTILNFLYVSADEHKKGCRRGLCQAPSGVSDLMCGDGAGQTPWGQPPCVSTVYDWRRGELAPESEWSLLLATRVCSVEYYRGYLLDKDANCSRLSVRSEHTRSVYFTGLPRKGYRNRDDRFDAQDAEVGTLYAQDSYAAKLERAVVGAIDDVSATPSSGRPLVTFTPTGGKTMNAYAWVFAYSTQVFESVILDAMFALLSFGFVFVYIWLNVGSLFLAAAGLFEIIFSVPLAYFFFSIVGNQVRFVIFNFLSVFLIMCIGADDIFVFMDSWKESGTLPSAVSGSVETRLKWTYAQAGSAMFVTTATTFSCLIISGFSTVPSIQAFGIFNALVVFTDYLLVMTWFPCCVVLYNRHFEQSSCCGCLAPCKPEAKAAGADGAPPAGPAEEAARVRVMRERLAPALHRWRYPLIGFSACAIVAMTLTFVFLFDLSDEVDPVRGFVVHQPRGQLLENERTQFLVAEDWQYGVYFVYGLDAEQPIAYPSNGQIVPEKEDETLRYVPFDFGESAQRRIHDDCAATKKNRTLVHEREGYCLLSELRKWAGGAWPYKDEKALRKALESFYESQHFADLADLDGAWRTKTGFVPDGSDGIKAVWQLFNATVPREASSAPTSLGVWYERWDEWAAARCAPQCFHVMLQYSSYNIGTASWAQLRFFSELLREFGSSIGYSLLVATVLLLLSTRNWVLALLVIGTIMATVLSALACVLAAGNKIGAIEATYTVLTIGLSIDYSVHLSHFYAHADGSRYERVQESLGKVGVSVVGGAITTAFAGLPLFGCAASFFFKFGFFIVFTSLWAIVYAFGLLLPLLLVLGPEGSQGSINRFLPKQARMRESVPDRNSRVSLGSAAESSK